MTKGQRNRALYRGNYRQQPGKSVAQNVVLEFVGRITKKARIITGEATPGRAANATRRRIRFRPHLNKNRASKINEERSCLAMSERTEEPKEVVKVDLPEGFLTTSKDDSFEGMGQYRILSRLKVIQSTAAVELKQEFGEGSVILSPGNVKLVSIDQQFLFVPCFFFTEYCHWSDLDDKVSQAIFGRSFDITSEIARKAKNEKTREEKYGQEDCFTSRYVEHLNFAGLIYGDHELAQIPVTLGFCRGEFGTGASFINSIQLRRINGQNVKLYGQVWQCGTAFRDKGPKKKWWGIDVKNPEIPYVLPEEFAFFQEQHEELKQQFKDRLLYVDREDEGKEGAVVDPTVQPTDEM